MTDRVLQAAARADVPPFYVMELFAAAQVRQQSHGDLISMVAGQPSTGAPEPVIAEAKRLVDSGPLGYTESVGIIELRRAIAEHYRRFYQLEIETDDVVITTGSSGGFALAFLAAFSPGDRVVMARPGYPCYRNVLSALGIEVVEVDCGAESRFQPSVQDLEAIAGPIAGLVIASPANPTGTMLVPDELAALARWCKRERVRLISDEIYHGIEYSDPPLRSSAWATSRSGLIFGSFSKYFSMTGWRIGWMLVPEDLRRAVAGLAGNFTICPPVLSQYAAVAAFAEQSYAELDGRVARYRINRELIFDGLRRIGIDKLAPADGAFYAYGNVSHLTTDSYKWCKSLLSNTGVAVAPGIDFDRAHGSDYVRVSFAGTAADIESALARIGAWIAG